MLLQIIQICKLCCISLSFLFHFWHLIIVPLHCHIPSSVILRSLKSTKFGSQKYRAYWFFFYFARVYEIFWEKIVENQEIFVKSRNFVKFLVCIVKVHAMLNFDNLHEFSRNIFLRKFDDLFHKVYLNYQSVSLGSITRGVLVLPDIQIILSN